MRAFAAGVVLVLIMASLAIGGAVVATDLMGRRAPATAFE